MTTAGLLLLGRRPQLISPTLVFNRQGLQGCLNLEEILARAVYLGPLLNLVELPLQSTLSQVLHSTDNAAWRNSNGFPSTKRLRLMAAAAGQLERLAVLMTDLLFNLFQLQLLAAW